MIVYRFERDGLGPYISGAGSIASRGDNKKPTRTQKKAGLFFRETLKAGGYRLDAFSKAHNNKKYIFGCKSKQQLRAYFSGNFKRLFKAGYRIKRYRVPDDEILDMTLEVAFPVKYHRLQTLGAIKKKIKSL